MRDGLRAALLWGGWAVGFAACGGGAEPDHDPAGGGAGSPVAAREPVCGVENTEAVAEQFCASMERECELTAACCNAEGFAGTAADCVVSRSALCLSEVRRNLAVGACFRPAAFVPECREFFLKYLAECSLVSLLSKQYQRELEALGCDQAWTQGSLAEGEPCTSSEQCAVPSEAFSAACFPDFQFGDESVCHVFERRFEGESCEDGTLQSCVLGLSCSSGDVCEELGDDGAPCEDGFADCNSRQCLNGICTDTTDLACESFEDCGGFANCVEGACRSTAFAVPARCDFAPPAVEL